VAHEVADFDRLFSVGGELGPVLRDGSMEVEAAVIGEHEGDDERHGLGC
jgi:hypothetical protein